MIDHHFPYQPKFLRFMGIYIYIISHDIQKSLIFPMGKAMAFRKFPSNPMVSEAEPKAKMVAGNTEVGIETKHLGGRGKMRQAATPWNGSLGYPYISHYRPYNKSHIYIYCTYIHICN